MMKTSVFVLSLTFVLQLAAATMAAQAGETPIIAYTIHVRLDAATKRLHATEVIEYANRSPAAMPDLYFHLYLNAFKNEQSTFARAAAACRASSETKTGGGLTCVASA